MPRHRCRLPLRRRPYMRLRLHNTRRTRAEADFSTDFQWASKSNSLQQDLRKLYNSNVFPDFEVVVEGEIIKVSASVR